MLVIKGTWRIPLPCWLSGLLIGIDGQHHTTSAEHTSDTTDHNIQKSSIDEEGYDSDQKICFKATTVEY